MKQPLQLLQKENPLLLSHKLNFLDILKEMLLKQHGNRRKYSLPVFCPFPSMFSTLTKMKCKHMSHVEG